MLTETLAARRQASPRTRPLPPAEGRRRPRREAGGRGKDTTQRLLAAGLAEFTERGFQAVTVDDIVRRAHTSHGTFYLYFANKDAFFAVLADKALRAMERVTDEFPVVTPTEAGRTALRDWVCGFFDMYQAHATVIKILSQADVVGREAWENCLARLLRLAEVVSIGMTAGRIRQGQTGVRASARGVRLDALACLLMLERTNFLLNSGIALPRSELVDRLTDVIFAAFHASPHAEARADAS